MKKGDKIISAGFIGILLVSSAADSLKVISIILGLIICVLIMSVGAIINDYSEDE